MGSVKVEVVHELHKPTSKNLSRRRAFLKLVAVMNRFTKYFWCEPTKK